MWKEGIHGVSSFLCINNFETGKEHFLNKYMLHFY